MIIFYGTNIRDNLQILMDIHVIKLFCDATRVNSHCAKRKVTPINATNETKIYGEPD